MPMRPISTRPQMEWIETMTGQPMALWKKIYFFIINDCKQQHEAREKKTSKNWNLIYNLFSVNRNKAKH